MNKTTKRPGSMRLSQLANSIIESEIEDRKKKRGAATKVTRTDIIEEALYKLAAQNPDKRQQIIDALADDPRFAAISEFLTAKGKDDAKR